MAIKDLDIVDETVVVAKQDGYENQRLVAYLVPAAGNAATVTKVRNSLAGKLPDYMVPSIFVMLETLPLLPSGKVDRLALPDPERARPALETALALAHDLRAEVSVLHVLPVRGYVSDSRYVDMETEKALEKLLRVVADLDPTVPVQVVVRRGDPAQQIPAVAREVGFHLVVLGAETNQDGWPGRVVERVARAGLSALLLVWADWRAESG